MFYLFIKKTVVSLWSSSWSLQKYSEILIWISISHMNNVCVSLHVDKHHRCCNETWCSSSYHVKSICDKWLCLFILFWNVSLANHCDWHKVFLKLTFIDMKCKHNCQFLTVHLKLYFKLNLQQWSHHFSSLSACVMLFRDHRLVI